MDIPSEDDLRAKRKANLVEKVMVWLRRERFRAEQEIVTELVEAGHDPIAVAAAALKLARANEKQRPIEPVGEVRFKKSPKERPFRSRKNGDTKRSFGRESHEEGMVRLALGTGKVDGIRINHVVSSLAKYANIPGRTIGKIRIQDRRTFVDVPEQFVDSVLSNRKTYRIGKQNVSVERA